MREKESRQQREDEALSKKLAELREELDADNEGAPDVIVIWKAIGRIARRNKLCGAEKGFAAYPTPEWVNQYLLQAADKINRLWLGIPPKDDRPLLSIGFGSVGELRKVPRGDRFRDERADHVGEALGFVRKGATAFQRHDRASRDAEYLEIHDNPDLDENRDLKSKVRTHLYSVIKKNEHIDSDEAVRNRLSRARRARSKAGAKS